MPNRAYSPKCSTCRQRTMALSSMPYSVKINLDGREYEVDIPSLIVPMCSNCKAFVLDDEANNDIDRAFRQHASLLTPEEIRSGREKLGLNQQAFAQCFGIAVSTLSRWETGSQIQQRFHDGILRAFFAMPDLRTFLAKLHGVLYATNGVSATISMPVSAPP